MNALTIIAAIRESGGTLHLQDGKLQVRGVGNSGEALPAEVREALANHRADVMIALGAPLDTVVSGILDEMRPQLPEGLRKLPDDRLLVLVNWSIIAAWEKTIQKFGQGGR